jgi:hypothetical protein
MSSQTGSRSLINACVSSQARVVVDPLQGRRVVLDPQGTRGPSRLPAVAARSALADRDNLGSPRLAHCAKGRGGHRNVSGHVSVLGLRLCDSGVSRLGDWSGDCGNARGHTSFSGSERHGTCTGGLDEADVVNQDCGWFLWLGSLVRRSRVQTGA